MLHQRPFNISGRVWCLEWDKIWRLPLLVALLPSSIHSVPAGWWWAWSGGRAGRSRRSSHRRWWSLPPPPPAAWRGKASWTTCRLQCDRRYQSGWENTDWLIELGIFDALGARPGGVGPHLLSSSDAQRELLEDKVQSLPVANAVVMELHVALHGPFRRRLLVLHLPGGLWAESAALGKLFSEQLVSATRFFFFFSWQTWFVHHSNRF